MNTQFCKFLSGVIALVFSLVLATQVQAAACGGGSLQDYIGLGAGGCTYQDLMFSNFAYDNSGGTLKIKSEDIVVGQDGIGDAYGLIFSASWDVTSTDLESKISYDVTALNNMELIAEFLLINGSMLSCVCTNTPGDGRIIATEDTIPFVIDALETYYNKDAQKEADDTSFDGIMSVSVETIVFLEAGFFSTASLQSTSNLFRLQAKAADVATPATWVLMLWGIFGAYMRRRAWSD